MDVDTEYPLDDEQYAVNGTQIADLKELVGVLKQRISDLEQAGLGVIANWEHGDLAGAVSWLNGVIGEED